MTLKRDVLRASALLALVVTALVSGCDGKEPEDVRDRRGDGDIPVATDPPNQVPEWLVEIAPRPEGRLQGGIAVSVKVELATRNRHVRLSIDGVDVTADSIVGEPTEKEVEVLTPSRLVYDPSGLDSPQVSLTPGVHVATARLLEFPEGLEEGDAVEIGSFTWSFEVF